MLDTLYFHCKARRILILEVLRQLEYILFMILHRVRNNNIYNAL